MLIYNKNLKQYSRELRKNMTDAERRLWSNVRMKQLNGCQFYRQRIIGNYIVDFFCPGAKLIIEVDGGQHNETLVTEKDEQRTKWLENQGFRVLRFWNNEVLENIDGVLLTIKEAIENRTKS